ncbi:MAG TPA: DNA alkylation repair protein [Pseudobacter sp.]|nr:DNA alkylation repair protein [Pseudobacter sp.]
MPSATAAAFTKRLYALQSDAELQKIRRYFKSGEGQYGEGDQFIGVRMGELFKLAQEFTDMEPAQLEILLESPVHELRAGAMSIMDKQGRSGKTSPERRKELYELYLRRHDRINNWDLVDLAAQYVVGQYLYDKSRKPLYKLARSKNIWERRTAIVATAYFIRKKETEDTFSIAALLVHDKEDLIHKAAGGWIREAGKQAPQRLTAFLDDYAAYLPRTFLRYAIEKLPARQRDHYMKLGKLPR